MNAEQGMYVNVILAVGGTVWVLVSGLIVYIWRNSMARISKLERNDEAGLSKLIDNPPLTINTHVGLCDRTISKLSTHFESQIDNSIKLISQKINLMEENIGLKIEKAILLAARNGRKGGE